LQIANSFSSVKFNSINYNTEHIFQTACYSLINDVFIALTRAIHVIDCDDVIGNASIGGYE